MDVRRESHTNGFEDQPDTTMSVFDLPLHLLIDGNSYDLVTRRRARGPLMGQEQR